MIIINTIPFAVVFYEKRLSPRYIDIATARYNKESNAGANSTSMPKRNKRERREKIMSTTSDRRKR